MATKQPATTKTVLVQLTVAKVYAFTAIEQLADAVIMQKFSEYALTVRSLNLRAHLSARVSHSVHFSCHKDM